VVESLGLYLVNAPSLILASFLCTKSRGLRAPVDQTAPARPSSEPVAGHPPIAQPTAYSPRGLEHQYQLVVQTAIKQLSKFNHCQLSHIKEDTGEPSVPVQERSGSQGYEMHSSVVWV